MIRARNLLPEAAPPIRSIRFLHLPYCLTLLESGRVAVLNRDYRLLGERRNRWIPDYAEYLAYLEEGAAGSKPVPRRALDRICLKPMRKEYEQLEVYIGWLYNDATVPSRSKANWAAYSARLEKLAKYGD